jgi:hypothetical protein
MEKKPQVFPSSDAMKEANELGTKIAQQANQEMDIDSNMLHKSQGELDADAKMKKDTLDNLEEQLRIREQFLKNKKAEANGETINENESSAPVTISYGSPEVKEDNKISDEDKLILLSKPQSDVPYDVIKLPSEGKLYKNGKATLDVAYLNATDENIITNPNLLQSGKFLEVLINRKMLNTNLRYSDLHSGDRNAIMIWLRATGFGPMYNIVLSDPKSPTYEEFTTEIDLSKLKTKYLGAEPDKEGLFDLKLNVSGSNIKFRLLTVGDVDDVEAHVNELAETMGSEFTDASPYTLKKQIIEVDGVRDVNIVGRFAENMRMGDVRQFRKYVDKIESGIDMTITVGTPGGSSVTTFLPLNVTFFWPDLEL